MRLAGPGSPARRHVWHRSQTHRPHGTRCFGKFLEALVREQRDEDIGTSRQDLRHLSQVLGVLAGHLDRRALQQGLDLCDFSRGVQYPPIDRLAADTQPGGGCLQRRGNLSGRPQGSLIQGRDGNFHGMTGYGGTTGSGMLFKMALAE